MKESDYVSIINNVILDDYPFKTPKVKCLKQVTYYFADESGHAFIPPLDSCWGPNHTVREILASLKLFLFETTDKRLKEDLEVLKKEALVNNTIRNILVNEDNMFEWRFSIFPPDEPFNVASFGIKINFPS